MTLPTFTRGQLARAADLQALADEVANVQGGVSLAPGVLSTMQGRLLVQIPSTGTTAEDSPNINAIRQALHTGGTVGKNAFTMRAYCKTGAGVTNDEWTFLAQMENYAATGSFVGAYLTARKRLGGTARTWAAVAEATDYNNAPSSTAGALIGIEVDCTSSDLDDGGTAGQGIRVGADIVVSKASGTTNACEVGYGARISIGSGQMVRRGFAVSGGTFNQAAFDASASTAGSRGGVTAAAFRSAKNQEWDFSGLGTHVLKLNSSGNVLQYRANGSTVLSMAQTGDLSVSNTMAADYFKGGGTDGARMLAYTSAVAPTVSDIGASMAAVWKNTGDGTVKLYFNDGGTLKSVALA